jgi:hypothetical protein
MPFVDSILEYAPPWLLGTQGRALLRTFGTVLDDQLTQLKDGIKARFPLTAPPDAIPYIAKDRGLEQGPNESNDAFAVRLDEAIPSHQTRGAAHTLLEQLAGYFTGTGTPPLRLVTQKGTWHEYDWTTGATTKTYGSFWNWDGLTQKWRGWVIIDGTSLGLGTWQSGGGATIDAGYVMGSTATSAQVRAVQRVVQKWKPAGMYVVRIIVTRTPGLFAAPPAHGRGPLHAPRWRMFQKVARLPNGQYGDPANFDCNATYWLSGGEEP